VTREVRRKRVFSRGVQFLLLSEEHVKGGGILIRIPIEFEEEEVDVPTVAG
jgi:hypothetical protein